MQNRLLARSGEPRSLSTLASFFLAELRTARQSCFEEVRLRVGGTSIVKEEAFCIAGGSVRLKGNFAQLCPGLGKNRPPPLGDTTAEQGPTESTPLGTQARSGHAGCIWAHRPHLGTWPPVGATKYHWSSCHQGLPPSDLDPIGLWDPDFFPRLSAWQAALSSCPQQILLKRNKAACALLLAREITSGWK